MTPAARRIIPLLAAGSLLLGLGSTACSGADPTADTVDSSTPGATIPFAPPPTFDRTSGTVASLRVEVVATHPHDDRAYTEGLVYAGPDALYESTGRYGQSTLREVAIDSGEIERSTDLDSTYFGEGLALSEGRLIQLTWKEHTAFVLDPDSFDQIGTFAYDTEGWGLCDDGARLVMSDGTSTLTFRDQNTFTPTGTVQVTLNGRPQASINELECVDGLVYANVFMTDQILVIDPTDGVVLATIDASGLLDEQTRSNLHPGDVLNGIAYDPDRGVFYLAGKNWPTLFETRFVPAG